MFYVFLISSGIVVVVIVKNIVFEKKVDEISNVNDKYLMVNKPRKLTFSDRMKLLNSDDDYQKLIEAKKYY